MAETVNTSALLLSDGQGGYSKAFVESMSDIVKLSDGSNLTEKLAEIDEKLPITLESGSLPETLKSGRILVKGSEFYCGNQSNSLCKLALSSDIPVVTPYVHPSTIQCSASSEIDSLKSSVSSGKTQVANAITGKGVSASQNDTFATLASKISSIISGTGKYEIADISGQTRFVDSDKVMSGSILNQVTNPFSSGNGTYVAYGYGTEFTSTNPSVCWNSSGYVYSNGPLNYSLSISESGNMLNVYFNFSFGYAPGWGYGFQFPNLLICKKFI